MVWYLPLNPRFKCGLQTPITLKTLNDMQMSGNEIDYFIIKLILYNGRTLIKKFLNLKMN